MSKQKENKKTPVITVLGHVDHGKTSLLDALRGTSVQEGEAGGITQHIRAHSFEFNGRKVTFVDTPGHEAFSQMRTRGGDVADVGILVVAADDGVKPQTKEAIGILLENEIPFVVAVNKIDKEGADTEKVKRELSTEDVLVEGYGGKVPLVEVSATKKTNLDQLMEMVFLTADLQEETEDADLDYGRATVLESKLAKGLGNVSLAIVREGTFKKGQLIATTQGVSKIRTLLDEFNKPVEIAHKGDPVLVVGLDDILPTGEVIFSVNSKEEGEKVVSLFTAQLEATKKETSDAELSEEDIASFFASQEGSSDLKEMPVLIKADTKGTLDAILDSVKGLKNKEAEVKIIFSGVGKIAEKDIELAKTTGAIVIAFNTPVESAAKKMASSEKVFLRSYKIIYELVDEVRDALEAMAKPEFEEKIIGTGKIIAKFELSKGELVAGTLVEDGEFKKNKKIYIMRGKERIAEGQITSMRHEKDEVSVSGKGNQVGLFIKPTPDFVVGDMIYCYERI